MRILLIAGVCLLAGAFGALAYSHYLGEGKQLAQVQADLDNAKASLAKATQDGQQAKSETEAMSAQIQQLTSTKDDLKKQLDQLQTAAPSPSAPVNPLAGMSGLMKAGMAQHNEEQLLLLESRLHLTPEQIVAVKAALEEESKRGEEMAARMFAGGKIDPQAVADLKNFKNLDQTLNDILTPDQKTEYQQMKTDQKNSAVETAASVQVNQLAPLLQLSDTQKDQVYSALAQVQLDTQDPAWIKNNSNITPGNPTAMLDAQAKAKEDALGKILTPDQLATYHQQAQSQLDIQKAMIQKFMPGNTTAGVTVAPAPSP